MNRQLKIALGSRLQSGAFGGGNQFAHSFKQHLESQGHRVAFSLTDDDIDVIVLTEPRPWSRGCAFDTVASLQYLRRHPNTRLIHRVNECDERKGRTLKLLNKLLCATAHQADAIVFISDWLHSLHTSQCATKNSMETVIHNGADSMIFNPSGSLRWDGKAILKIVTHHWADNWYKGWDVYQKLDHLLETKFAGKIEFTFVGKPLPNITLKHTKIIHPLSGVVLAQQLKQHHAYLTASLNEPAGMHHVEALQCGLPLIYRNSGALPEYCKPYGIPFEGVNDIEKAIRTMMQEYNLHKDSTKKHTHDARAMCKKYEELLIKTVHTSRHARSYFILPIRMLQATLWLRDTIV